MKKTTKLFTFLTLFVLLTNCEREELSDNLEEVVTEQKSDRIEHLSFDQLKLDDTFKEVVKDFKLDGAYFELDDSSIRKSGSNKELSLDKSTINVIKKGEYISYTFLMNNHKEGTHIYDNLVIEKYKDTLRGFFIRYFLSKENIDAYNKGIQSAFSGKVQRSPYKGDIKSLIEKINSNKVQTKSYSCTNTYVTTPVKCDSGKHWPWEQCNFKDKSKWGYYKTGYIRVCTHTYPSLGSGITEMVDYIEDDSTFGGNPGSGSSTQPNIPGNDSENGELLAKISHDLGLFAEQEDFLRNHEVLLENIKKFFDENGKTTENENLAKKIVEAGVNGTLISAAPFFKYPKGSNYSNLYPKTTEYLSKQIPKSINNSEIVEAIKEITGLTKEEISKDLEWGEGPLIDITQLDNYPGCSSCTDVVAALFDPKYPDKVFIDSDFVNLIENGNLSTEDSNNLQLFFTSTVLHEYVHLADNIDAKDYPGEEGSIFEVKVWGAEYANNLRKIYVGLIRK